MLLIVQLTQVARAKTTYESMHRHDFPDETKVTSAFATAIAAGATPDAAQITSDGRGPDPAVLPLDHAASTMPPRRSKGFARCLKLLGVDTFVKTAQDGLDPARRRVKPRNPFNAGLIQNCKDFWCDPAPVWGWERRGGETLIGGEVVDYYTLYESPALVRARREGGYRSLPAEEEA